MSLPATLNINICDYPDLKKLELTAEISQIEVERIKIEYVDKEVDIISDNFVISVEKSRFITVKKPINSLWITCFACQSDTSITKGRVNRFGKIKTKTKKGRTEDILVIYGIM